MKVCVVGAGVIGLSTAVNIIDNIVNWVEDVEVHLIADKFSPNTTSDAAAGFWEPYMVGSTPTDKIMKWGTATLQHVLDLSRSTCAPDVGAFPVYGYSIHQKEEQPPFWKDVVHGHRPMNENELKHFPNYKCGFAFMSTIIECKKYLPWLLSRFQRKGGIVLQRKLHSLEEIYPDYNIIVNCSGVGSVDLAKDQALQPIRGQVIKVKAPWIKTFVYADNGAYIFPGTETVTLGGSIMRGSWNLNVDKNITETILKECCEMVPSLQRATYVEDKVGLRPARPQVRLEKEVTSSFYGTKQIIHNYGHSGAGVTLHWGCAIEASQLVHEAIQQINMKSNL